LAFTERKGCVRPLPCRRLLVEAFELIAALSRAVFYLFFVGRSLLFR